MVNGLLRVGVLAACASLMCAVAPAQEVVHALTGTVRFVDANSKTITVITDDKSEGQFKDLTDSKPPAEFDKRTGDGAAGAITSDKVGEYVIVFYYGGGEMRRVVLLRNLGRGPFTQNRGTVVKFDNKERVVSVKDESGKIDSYKITADTVAETAFGAQGGSKFSPRKGDQIKVIAVDENGSPTAVFINAV
jgi:hypothetical protein